MSGERNSSPGEERTSFRESNTLTSRSSLFSAPKKSYNFTAPRQSKGRFKPAKEIALTSTNPRYKAKSKKKKKNTQTNSTAVRKVTSRTRYQQENSTGFLGSPKSKPRDSKLGTPRSKPRDSKLRNSFKLFFRTRSKKQKTRSRRKEVFLDMSNPELIDDGTPAADDAVGRMVHARYIAEKQKEAELLKEAPKNDDVNNEDEDRKGQAVRRRGEFIFGPSVAMKRHHDNKTNAKSAQVSKTQGKQTTRVFRRYNPFSSKLVRQNSKRTKKSSKKGSASSKKTLTPTNPDLDYIVENLRKVILFNNIEPSTLEQLADAMKPRKYQANIVVCQKGDYGDEMFIIKEGEVTVSGGTEDKDGDVLKLGPGSSFGELGMNYGSPRVRTITAISPLTVYVLNRRTFGSIVENEHLRTNELMFEALSKVKILDKLNHKQLINLVKYVELVTFPAGKRIIKKGTLGGTFYMIVSGTVSCQIFEEGSEKSTRSKAKSTPVKVIPAGDASDADDASIVVVETNDAEADEELEDLIQHTRLRNRKLLKKTYNYGKGQYFGERALLQGDRLRKADVIAKTNVELLAINYDTFSEHLGGLVDAFEENIRLQALEDTPLFNTLSPDEQEKLQTALQKVSFSDGEQIMAEDTENESFYIVRDGNVEVRKKLEGKAADVDLATLGSESYFGEGSLLLGQKTTASVFAKGDVTCYMLDKKDFNRLIKPDKREMLSRTFHERNRRIAKLSRERKNELLKNVSLSEVERITNLGSGCFGLVKLVAIQGFKTCFALKVLEKGAVVKSNQEVNVLNEKNILLEADHPFIVKLYRTFKDKKYLYLLMEYVQGGEMFQYLHRIRNGYLDNDTARFFIACVVDALDFLHKRRIVYRDLKPENLMIDTEGYAKMVDFGFAKKLLYKTFTLCGTAQYLAPEILLNRGYAGSVDFWCLGILTYELFTGTTPFKRSNRNELFNAIKTENRIKFTRRWRDADAAKKMVCQLLHKNPHKRLGYGEHKSRGFKEVKKHAWFEPIDFQKLFFKEIAPPWNPPQGKPRSYSNFEEYDEEENPLTGKYDDRAGDSKLWKDF